MAVCTFVMLYSRLHFWLLYAWLSSVHSVGRHQLDRVVHLSLAVFQLLDSWRDLGIVCKGVLYRPSLPSRTMITDSSMFRCGAHMGHLLALGLVVC